MREKMPAVLVAGLAMLTCGIARGETSPAADAAAPRVRDGAIIRAVQTELLAAAGIPYYSVHVSVIDGIVSLTGTVDTILDRRRVADFARTASGVRGMVNRIEAAPSSRSDAELRDDVVRSLLLDPVTESHEIEVSVSGGLAMLEGVVSSVQEQRAARRAAEGVAGVAQVQSSLTVDRDRVRSDGDIAADVRAMLRWDPRVDHEEIQVAVEKGRVSLVGGVESARERSAAAEDAWVAGVRAVDASGLEVASSRDDGAGESETVQRTDAEIRRAVEDTFRYDPRLAPCALEVRARGGTVTLVGRVKSKELLRVAEEDALNAIGVGAVDNRLRVGSAFDRPRQRAAHQTSP